MFTPCALRYPSAAPVRSSSRSTFSRFLSTVLRCSFTATSAFRCCSSLHESSRSRILTPSSQRFVSSTTDCRSALIAFIITLPCIWLFERGTNSSCLIVTGEPRMMPAWPPNVPANSTSTT